MASIIQSKSNALNIKNVAKPKRNRKSRKGSKRIPYSKIGSQIFQDVASLRKLLNTELKFIDIINTAQSVGTTYSLFLMNGLTQGATVNEREGDTVKFSRLQNNVRFSINPSSVLGFVCVRALVVIDHQPNGAVFTASVLMGSTTNILSPINNTWCKRFTILSDEIITLSLNGPETFVWRHVQNLNLHTEYGLGNAGTIADISNNSLYFVIVSDDNTNMPTYDYWFRLQYVDN
jgi:hypothetical protein